MRHFSGELSAEASGISHVGDLSLLTPLVQLSGARVLVPKPRSKQRPPIALTFSQGQDFGFEALTSALG
jgi:hypothetical protein